MNMPQCKYIESIILVCQWDQGWPGYVAYEDINEMSLSKPIVVKFTDAYFHH